MFYKHTFLVLINYYFISFILECVMFLFMITDIFENVNQNYINLHVSYSYLFYLQQNRVFFFYSNIFM